MKLGLEARRALKGYLFISPWIIGTIFFALGPFVQSFIISLSEVDMFHNFQLTYIGLEHYREAFVVDEEFVPLLLTTLRDSLIDVPIILVFSLIAAFLVNQKLHGMTFYRAVLFLPVVVASGIVVEQLFTQEIGNMIFAGFAQIAEIIFQYFGGAAAQFFLTLMDRLILVLWRSGVQIILFLAGFQGISSSLYEAARCDGATDWEVFWKITLPMLSPIILVNIIYTIVDSFTDIFNEMLFFIRNIAFSGQFRLGYAAAVGWIYFLMIFLIIIGVTLWSRRWVFYQGER